MPRTVGSRASVPPTFLRDILLHHLLGRCRHCRAEFEAYEIEQVAGTSALQRVAKESPADAALLARLAERDLKELVRLPTGERQMVVEKARLRFRGPAVIRLLLAESDRVLQDDPRAATRTWSSRAEWVSAPLSAGALSFSPWERRCGGQGAPPRLRV